MSALLGGFLLFLLIWLFWSCESGLCAKVRFVEYQSLLVAADLVASTGIMIDQLRTVTMRSGLNIWNVSFL